MDLIWIIVSATVGVGMTALWLGRRGAAKPPPDLRRGSPGAPESVASPAPPASVRRDDPVPAATLPSEIADLQWVSAESLAPERLQAVVYAFRDVPRPPRLLTQLASMDPMQDSSRQRLMGIIVGEPLICAKVLAAVNSPVYGLRRPVSGLGQAVTFLGMNSVRNICMQHALMQAFQADRPGRAQRLAAIWRASALATELTQYPLQRLAFPDPGGLTSAVLLSFLGELAVAVAVPPALLEELPARDTLQRLRSEQDRLGLGAAEIGLQLMQQWGLPPAVVAEVSGIARGLVTPHRPQAPALAWQTGPLTVRAHGDATGLRSAFGFLCVCLGERLAWGELQSLDDFDLATDESPELACARSFLAAPRFAALVEKLRSPHLVARMTELQALPMAIEISGAPARVASPPTDASARLPLQRGARKSPVSTP